MSVSDPVIPLLLTTFAGLATGVGSLSAFGWRQPHPWFLAASLGFSAGVMLFVTFLELLPRAVADIGFAGANIAFFVGIAVIAVLDLVIPHEYAAETESRGGADEAMKRAGTLVALGIAIHNFPEGMVTFAAATSDIALGATVAVAVGLHNAAEGVSVALPILYATGDRRRAFLYSLLSGLTEPVGGVVTWLFLSSFLSSWLLPSLLAFTGGIMVFISLDELLPVAHRHASPHVVIAGVVAGMALMAATLVLLG